MVSYGKKSLVVRDQMCSPLAVLFNSLLADGIDHSLLESHRSRETHQGYLDADPPVTTVQYEDSKHSTLPSRAVDAVPYVKIPGKSGGIHWADPDPKIRELYWKQMCFFAGLVVMRGQALGFTIRSGIDWDRDWSVVDTRFFDAPHFEFVGYIKETV